MKKEIQMRNSHKGMPFPGCVAFVAIIGFLLAACGGDSSGTGVDAPDMRVETMENLPNCTENREGTTALVAEDSSTYKCEEGRWIFMSAPLPTVSTLDDLSNCTAKIDGDTVKVEKESAVYRCDDGEWIKYYTLTDTLATSDDLLACVEKREGNSAYITEEHALYKCDDGVWEKIVSYMDTVSTKDALGNCTAKREGDSTYVSKENSVYLCIESAWRYLGTVAANSDELPNCTEKRNNEQAFVVEEYMTLICNESKWYRFDIYTTIEKEEVKSSSSVKSDNRWEDYAPNSSSSSRGEVESKSSSSSIMNDAEKSSSSSVEKDELKSSSSRNSGEQVHYDCGVYNCVTTEYLNQEMLAAGEYGELLDERDNQVYRTIQIGNQVWMAQNLNYVTNGGNADDGAMSMCYDDDLEYCKKYGRIYSWTASMDLPSSETTYSFVSKGMNKSNYQGLCPTGFHVSSYTDLQTLLDYIRDVGKTDSAYVLSTKNWNSSKSDVVGTDLFGLSIVPSGWKTDYGGYVVESESVRYWLNLDESHESAFTWGWGVDAEDDPHGCGNYVDCSMNYSYYKFYLRCVKDPAE